MVFAFIVMLIPAFAANSLFPEFPGWKLQQDSRIYTGKDLWELIDGAADIFLSYDFKDLQIGEYTKGDQIIRVELYKHSTPENAFGIFAAERMPDYPQVNVGLLGYKSTGVLNFYSGVYYVKIMSAGAADADENAIAALASQVNTALAQSGVLPAELALFPKEDMEPVSESYIAQNFLGYGFLHSAFTARYTVRDASFQAFIIHTTPADIQKMQDEYSGLLKDDKPVKKGDLIILHDPYNGTVFMKTKGDYLAGVINTDQEGLASQYLDRVLQNIK